MKSHKSAREILDELSFLPPPATLGAAFSGVQATALVEIAQVLRRIERLIENQS